MTLLYIITSSDFFSLNASLTHKNIHDAQKEPKALSLGVQEHGLNNEAVQCSADDHMPVRNQTYSSIFFNPILYDLRDM